MASRKVSDAVRFVYVTNPTKGEARRIANHLMLKKLIGCAVIWPAESIYRWKSKIADEIEYVLLAKTTERNAVAVRKEVEKIHPYEVPCIVTFSGEANPAYARWLTSEVRG